MSRPSTAAGGPHRAICGHAERTSSNAPCVDYWTRFFSASTAALFAETLTYPLDMAKTHLQIRRHKIDPSSYPYRMGSVQLGIKQVHSVRLLDPKGMLQSAKRIVQRDGFCGLFRGVQPAVARAICNNAFSVTLYRPILAFLTGEQIDQDHTSLFEKIVAAALTGACSQIVANPADFIKVRLQTDSRLHEPRYTGIFDVVRRTARSDPLLFWSGLHPAIIRACVGVSATIAVYAHSKQILIHTYGMSDNPKSSLISSALSGLSASIFSCPADVVKTRMMSQKSSIVIPFEQRYSSATQCFVQIVKTEGPLALFKGIIPTYIRLGPWQMIFFVSCEEISRQLNGKPFF